MRVGAVEARRVSGKAIAKLSGAELCSRPCGTCLHLLDGLSRGNQREGNAMKSYLAVIAVMGLFLIPAVPSPAGPMKSTPMRWR